MIYESALSIYLLSEMLVDMQVLLLFRLKLIGLIDLLLSRKLISQSNLL